jgi:LysR family glycine cleavage system transcriptional activator
MSAVLPIRQRPLSIGPLRAFEAVARRLSFRAAAEELNLTQSAISRQIKALEDEIGCTLFLRGTRHVALTADGVTLQGTAVALLTRLDQTVRQIRQTRGRQVVNVTTFASFASLWLIPRLEAFQRAHPDIDIRVSAHDEMVELDDSELDVALRYARPEHISAQAQLLFGETMTPVVSPWLLRQSQDGSAPPLRTAADLAQHTLAEEDDNRPSSEYVSWRRWLKAHGQPLLQPRRWMYLNFTYQRMQTALTGQAVALARRGVMSAQLRSGELVEPFGDAGRLSSPYAYWLLQSAASRNRPEVVQFVEWVASQAAESRQGMEDASV